MKLINNIIYVEFADFINAGWKADAIKKANLRNGPFWQMIKNPADFRMPLVQFETLRPKDKARIIECIKCDPAEYVALEPIKKLLVLDAKAEQFYRDHRFDNNNELSAEHQKKYTIAASWLNLIDRVLSDKKNLIKNELHLKIDQFIDIICSIIKADNIELPSSHRRLIYNPDSALKEYKKNGYESIISEKFCNKNRNKIGKGADGYSEELELQQTAVIRKLARLHMNLDAVQIASYANVVFAKNGWHQVSSSTIQNIIAKNMTSLYPGRRGVRKFNSNVAMQVVRERPKYPSHFWTLDGWTVELLYKDGNKSDNRLVMVVVLDAVNKYPVGYAIGERENSELIKMALRNAVVHMHDLFGATYRPWQLQSDRYALKNLTPFYGAIAHLHTPAAVGNAKAKIIEPYFKDLNKKYCQPQFNWSGFNITAKNSNQPNTEMLNKIKHSFPDKDGCIQQINHFMFKERQAKVEEYKTKWSEMPESDQVTLSPEECIMVFGKAHDYTNSITGHGLIATIEGQKLYYDSFDPAFRALQFNTDFKIVYIPDDLSQALAITADGKQKFLVHNKMAIGMGFKNTTPEQLEYHQQIRDFNKDRKEEILQNYIDDDALVNDVIMNTPLNLDDDDEAALKLMLTFKGQQKERLQDAKGLKQAAKVEDKKQAKQLKQSESEWERERMNYLHNKIDYNQYTD